MKTGLTLEQTQEFAKAVVDYVVWAMNSTYKKLDGGFNLSRPWRMYPLNDAIKRTNLNVYTYASQAILEAMYKEIVEIIKTHNGYSNSVYEGIVNDESVPMHEKVSLLLAPYGVVAKVYWPYPLPEKGSYVQFETEAIPEVCFFQIPYPSKIN